MRKFFFLITALLLLAGPALGYDVLLVQSSRNAAYEEIAHGFRISCAKDSRFVVLSDYGKVDVFRIVREDRPRLVVAIGDEALSSLKHVRQTPILAVMTLGVRAANTRANVTGVDLFVAPENFLPVLQSLNAKRVGMIYSAAKTGWYVKRAIAAARQVDVEIVPREVRDPRDTVQALESLTGKVDALWMVPDTTAMVRETLPAYFNFSLQQKAPVVSFTAVHLGHGAAAAVDIDRSALGRQAGQMAMKLLNGVNPDALPVEQPQAFSVKINPVVLQNLGLPIPPRYISSSTHY